jgi:hypothetical protein
MRILPRSALGLLVVTLLVACNADQLPPPGQYSTVSGHIVDRATNQPVAGAIVTIDTVLTVTTDAAGAFSIDKVPAGTLDYTVKADGYALVSATATAEPGKTFTLDVALERAASAP